MREFREAYKGRSRAAGYFQGPVQEVWKSDFRIVVPMPKRNPLDVAFQKKIDTNIRVSFVLSQNFWAFLWKNVSSDLKHNLRDYHQGMAALLPLTAGYNLQEAMKGNPRPNRKGARGLRHALLSRWSDLSRYDEKGWETDFNKLDRLVLDEQGRPYWKAVLYGYGAEGRDTKKPFETRGYFKTAEGHFIPPSSRRHDPFFKTVKSPRPRTPRVLLNFSGYDYINEKMFRDAKREFQQTAFWNYVNIMAESFPEESREFIVRSAKHLAVGNRVVGGFGKPYRWSPNPMRGPGGRFESFRTFSR